MIGLKYSHNGLNVSAVVATENEAESLAVAIYLTYGVRPVMNHPAKHTYAPKQKVRVTAWSGEWEVITVDGPTLWLRPWRQLGEPKPAPVSLCERILT